MMVANKEDLQTIFEHEMSAFGRIVSPIDYPESMRPTLTGMLTQFMDVIALASRRPAPAYTGYNIYVNIVDNPHLNAVAFESSGHEFIAVYAGALFFLYDAFLSLFSHPKFMPDIGEASKERATNEELRAWLQRRDVTLIGNFVPLDIERTKAAQFLTFNAYNFIFAHEVAHLTKGHLKYLEKVYGIFKYFAYADQSSAPFGTPLRHVLEIGADENGAHASLHMFKPHAIGKTLPDIGGLLCDFRTWAISTGVIFALFDRHAELYEPAVLTSHPSPDIRFLNVIWSAWEEIKRIVPDEYDAAARQTIRASIELNNFFTQLKMATRPFSLVAPGNTPRRELYDQVSELRDRLLKLEAEQMEKLAVERSDLLRKKQAAQ